MANPRESQGPCKFSTVRTHARTEATLNAFPKLEFHTTHRVALDASLVALEKVSALETRNAYLILLVARTIVTEKVFRTMLDVADFLQVG